MRSKRLNNWSLDIPDLDVDPRTPSPVWPVGNVPNMEKILHLTDTHIQLNYEVCPVEIQQIIFDLMLFMMFSNKK